jgi:hypothetical protein
MRSIRPLRKVTKMDFGKPGVSLCKVPPEYGMVFSRDVHVTWVFQNGQGVDYPMIVPNPITAGKRKPT